MVRLIVINYRFILISFLLTSLMCVCVYIYIYKARNIQQIIQTIFMICIFCNFLDELIFSVYILCVQQHKTLKLA